MHWTMPQKKKGGVLGDSLAGGDGVLWIGRKGELVRYNGNKTWSVIPMRARKQQFWRIAVQGGHVATVGNSGSFAVSPNQGAPKFKNTSTGVRYAVRLHLFGSNVLLMPECRSENGFLNVATSRDGGATFERSYSTGYTLDGAVTLADGRLLSWESYGKKTHFSWSDAQWWLPHTPQYQPAVSPQQYRPPSQPVRPKHLEVDLWFRSITAIDHVLWGCTVRRDIVRSDDDGRTWKMVFRSDLSEPIFAGSGDIVAVASAHSDNTDLLDVHLSTDGGQTFHHEEFRPLDVAPKTKKVNGKKYPFQVWNNAAGAWVCGETRRLFLLCGHHLFVRDV